MIQILKRILKSDKNSKRNCVKDRFPNTQSQLDMITEMTNFYSAKDKLLQTLLAMVNYTEGIAMWIKDDKDRYIFADKALRNLMFNKKSISEVINKTDYEILYGKKEDRISLTIPDLEPKQLPNIKKIADRSIFNLTDTITRSFGYSCRFFEVFEDRAFDVWKTPIIKDGKVTHTSGCLVDITSEKEYRKCVLEDLEQRNEAFRIDNTNSYYLTRYNFEDFSFKACKPDFS